MGSGDGGGGGETGVDGQGTGGSGAPDGGYGGTIATGSGGLVGSGGIGAGGVIGIGGSNGLGGLSGAGSGGAGSGSGGRDGGGGDVGSTGGHANGGGSGSAGSGAVGGRDDGGTICTEDPSSSSACQAGTVCERVSPASCADPDWAEWPVPPSALPSNYTDNQDGTVTDTVTGLIWQQVPATTTMSFSAAGTYCSTTLTLGRHSDWRLPTKIELLSIVDYGADSPAINGTYFSGPTGNYWTSTLVASSPANAWIVGFSNGSTDGADKTFYNNGNVRCVR